MPGLLPKTAVRVFEANMAKNKMDKWQALDFQAKETQKRVEFVDHAICWSMLWTNKFKKVLHWIQLKGLTWEPM